MLREEVSTEVAVEKATTTEEGVAVEQDATLDTQKVDAVAQSPKAVVPEALAEGTSLVSAYVDPSGPAPVAVADDTVDLVDIIQPPLPAPSADVEAPVATTYSIPSNGR